MNNREFYNKWGNTAILKSLISGIFVLGMETITENPGYLTVNYTEDMLNGPFPGPGNMIQLAECYRDFKAMPDSFKKNVIKKVL